MKIVYEANCSNYSHPNHDERPERVLATSALLQAQTQVPLSWVKPGPCPEQALLRVHTPAHLVRLQEPREFDEDTPWIEGIFEYAKSSAAAALTGLDIAMSGENAFSLMRPPGHHATQNSAMGFCYLNNVAIAALEALARGCRQVAVFDFDAHHGNGTESILLGVPRTTFASVHQFPCYPDTGLRNVGSNCYNYPVPPKTHREEYKHVLQDAIDHVTRGAPDLIIVSAGFDCYARDPLAEELLEAEDFLWLGSALKKLNIPVLSALEGGYSTDLPSLVLAYLRGLEGT